MKKSGKKIPDRIVKLYQKLRHIRSVYIDTCFVGYLTDDDQYKERGDLIVRYLQNYKIIPFYSNLVIEELSEIEDELDDDKKLHDMVDLWIKVLEDLGACSLKVVDISSEEKKFYRFLLDLGLSKNDAIHFTITVFYDIDSFLSFNKNIFTERKRKIDRELMKLKRKTPIIFQVDELYRELKKLDEYGLIS
jgi:hypothetical protein